MKRCWLVLLAVMALGLIGCGDRASEEADFGVASVPIEDESQEQAEADAGAPEEEEAQQEGQDLEKTEISAPSYYGQWKVVDFIAPGITALSTNEMEGYIALLLTYGADAFELEGKVVENPVYEETVVSKGEFAESFQNQVTFESLAIAGDSVISVSVVNAAAFGSSFYVADENTLYIPMDGAFFKAVRQSEEEMKPFELTEKGKNFLTDMCRTLPDFEGYATMDEEFWWNFLFYAYTGASPDEAELVQIPREDLGFEETAVKVSLEEVEAYAKLVLGTDLPDFKPAFEDMPEGQTACFYRDGYYYIGVSDFPDFRFTFSDVTVYEERFETFALATYNVSMEDEENVGTVTFHLYPADNENGFTIVSKVTEL